MAPALVEQPGTVAPKGWLPMHVDPNERIESAVLALVLAEHPTLLTLSDLVMEIDAEHVVGDAVSSLVAVGLLRREGGSVLATRAALRFDALDPV
jgi:hypothetical protein